MHSRGYVLIFSFPRYSFLKPLFKFFVFFFCLTLVLLLLAASFFLFFSFFFFWGGGCWFVDCVFSKGISSSALPYKRTPPSWLKISSQDVRNLKNHPFSFSVFNFIRVLFWWWKIVIFNLKFCFSIVYIYLSFYLCCIFVMWGSLMCILLCIIIYVNC